MKWVGYSGKPLIGKLGYQPGDTVLVVNAPEWFLAILNALKINVTDHLPATWAHGFFTTQAELGSFLKNLDLQQIEKSLWVSWPKKASRLETDLTEQTFRDLILPYGWVDTKVAAIDETWSALKFVRRRA